MSSDQKLLVGGAVVMLLLARLTQPMPVVYGIIGGIMALQSLLDNESQIWRTAVAIIGIFIVGAVALTRGILW